MIKKTAIFLTALVLIFSITACELTGDTSNGTTSSESSSSIGEISSEISSTSSDKPSTSQGGSFDGNYSEDEIKIINEANNIITWQIPDNGGWDKDIDTHKSTPHVSGSYRTKGWTVNGKPLGTIDNGATYTEMEIIAKAYQINKDEKYVESLRKAIEFIKKLQGEKGGIAQVYPKRGQYSDYATINDNAMVKTLNVVDAISKNKAPYTDMLTQAERNDCKQIFDKGVDFLLKSQIVVNGKKTAWCAQHDQVTYAPMPAREYELASISGSESVGVINLLLSLTDNQDAQNAAMDAIRWFDSVKLENKAYNNKASDGNYIYDKQGSVIWYRFYDLQGKGFFSDRKSNPKYAEYNGYFYDIHEISEERRTGYSWMGSWPKSLVEKYMK